MLLQVVTRTADRWSPLRGGACEGTLTVRGLGLRFAVKAKNNALARIFLLKGASGLRSTMVRCRPCGADFAHSAP